MLFLPAAHAQDYTLADDLRSSSTASVAYGGTFTGSGWRVDDANSRLFWDFGTQLERGEVSVTISDVALEDVTGANNHLIELFSSGGHSDHNRAINFRVYGRGWDTDPASDWGQIKLVAWDRATDLFAESRASGFEWDGLPHVWRITWDTSTCAIYRDGVALIELDVSGIDLRVGTLWLPLNNWGGDYSAPIGTLYSDLSLQGWEPGASTDTGVPDDGDPATVTPLEDATAASWSAGVYSDVDDLNIENDGATPAAISYLSFDLSAFSGTVTEATLELHARAVSEAEGDGGTVYTVADTTWDEDTLTWGARPALGGALGTFGAVSPSGTYTVDVTAGVQAGGRVAFALASDGSNSAHFSSKEDGDGSGAAVLRVVTIPTRDETDTDTDADADADTDADSDSGIADSGRQAPGSREAHTTLGCSCDTTPGASPVLALFVLAGTRRRRAR